MQGLAAPPENHSAWGCPSAGSVSSGTAPVSHLQALAPSSTFLGFWVCSPSGRPPLPGGGHCAREQRAPARRGLVTGARPESAEGPGCWAPPTPHVAPPRGSCAEGSPETVPRGAVGGGPPPSAEGPLVLSGARAAEPQVAPSLVSSVRLSEHLPARPARLEPVPAARCRGAQGGTRGAPL